MCTCRFDLARSSRGMGTPEHALTQPHSRDVTTGRLIAMYSHPAGYYSCTCTGPCTNYEPGLSPPPLLFCFRLPICSISGPYYFLLRRQGAALLCSFRPSADSYLFSHGAATQRYVIFLCFPMSRVRTVSLGGTGFSSLVLVTAARSARGGQRVESSCARPVGPIGPGLFRLPVTT